jgi:hypothetical protein
MMLLAVLIGTTGCESRAYDPGGALTPQSIPSEAEVSDLKVFPGERREGMRKVEVTVKTIERAGKQSQSLIITEWVPVVLLRRLTVGAKVGLTSDPLDEDRPTLAL